MGDKEHKADIRAKLIWRKDSREDEVRRIEEVLLMLDSNPNFEELRNKLDLLEIF